MRSRRKNDMKVWKCIAAVAVDILPYGTTIDAQEPARQPADDRHKTQKQILENLE